MKYIQILIMLLIAFPSLGQLDPKLQAFKDSVIQRIEWDEFIKLDIYKRRDFIRKMRGEPIFEEKLDTHDENGIAIVRGIDKDKALRQVRERYALIEKEKSHYRQAVFPNAYKDAVEELFGPFYENNLTRVLHYPDYKNLEGENHDGPYDVKSAENDTRRTYYFNQKDQLRLIEVIRQIDVNEGEKYDHEEKITKIGYDKKWYYVWNDSLQFYYHLYQRSKIKSGHIYFEDTLKADGSSERKYFYLHNCFKSNEKEGEFDYANWEKNIESSESKKSYPDTDEVIEFKNLVLEYQEYKEGKNDYLQPVEYSFIKKPYIVEPEE
ncbi:hypothetical protein [Reichenbachiella versicolor]|uniref:hypothetical protein n=1 Tax=Reichenbachiella versicolor TaxID=1821036 RepID=UPI0013A54C67|nr:hypothetical protein [Reichenbachiella versicolor]